ncbi:carboxypeptidase-like regulatory domain-containing protein [uncultured Polaribacter sp.]|uniref:carboxypeptidase-like regulatory domain-containing protein n=1 Tax=uncultured Polaribacter sp. TaxID=174711 RepID=UPI00259B251E|nr:carboxypeptidase-like regulatory domain-containing protein [uncultured Polaribacter sp.]
MKYKIKIAEPCHEKWSEMTPTQQGKFCASCNKEVIDFTKLTNGEISKKVLNAPNLCGRFNAAQLDKEIETNQKNNLSKIAASLALISAISASGPIFSQSKKDTLQEVHLTKGKVLIKKDSLDKFITIKGKVKDLSGVLLGASILLKGSKIGAQTDFDGNFSIKIPNKKRNSHILVFSYLGYKNQEVDILSIKKPLVVKMEEDDTVLGDISIIAGMVAVEKKPNIFKRIGNLFRKKENKKQ